MIGWALSSCSGLFRAAVLMRHFLYDNKILSQRYAPLPVVSIGNIMSGGAGKTQTALLLAEQLVQEIPLAILSRGYRGKAEHASIPLIVNTKTHTPFECGDEPWLLASRLTSALVVVNKNRFKSALSAEKKGAKLLILDDGMQHRSLHRDIEIVVIDSNTPFGAFLPKGNRREDLSRLKQADLILYVGQPDRSFINHISMLTAAPHAVATIVGQGFFDLDGNAVDLKNQRIGIFCGIGDPKRFVRTVEGLGIDVVATHFLRDHCAVKEKELRRFAMCCKEKGASYLLCTEKDKIKISSKDLPLPILWLKTQLAIVENQKAWIQMLSEIKQLAQIAPLATRN